MPAISFNLTFNLAHALLIFLTNTFSAVLYILYFLSSSVFLTQLLTRVSEYFLM